MVATRKKKRQVQRMVDCWKETECEGFKRHGMGACPIACGWLQLQSERTLKLLSIRESGSLNDDSG